MPTSRVGPVRHARQRWFWTPKTTAFRAGWSPGGLAAAHAAAEATAGLIRDARRGTPGQSSATQMGQSGEDRRTPGKSTPAGSAMAPFNAVTLITGAESDWMLVTRDVAERIADVGWALRTLRGRSQTAVSLPGNHELCTSRDHVIQLWREWHYRHLVEVRGGLGVVTPEDTYPVWGERTAVHVPW